MPDWDFPGHPVVEISPSSSGSVGSIPGQEAKISHASQLKNPKTSNRSKIVTNSMKTLKMVHIKKKRKKSLKQQQQKAFVNQINMKK